MTGVRFSFLCVVLVLGGVSCLGSDETLEGLESLDEFGEVDGLPVVSSSEMSYFDLTLPFSAAERHVVTQGPYGSVSHAADGETPLAVDFSGRRGSPVLAPFSGRLEVESSGEAVCPSVSGMPARGANGGFGHHVYIYYGGCRVHLAHLDSLEALDGYYIRQGAVVGYEGSTGCTTGTNLHVDCSCRERDSSVWQPVRCEPMSGFRRFAEGQVFGEGEYPTLPVGTTVQAFGHPEIYLVCEANTLCHIADWEAYRSRRFFYSPRLPTSQVVMVNESVLDCYRRGPQISGTSERYLIDCLEGDFVVFREGGHAIRRWIPFNFESTRAESELILTSWGLRYPDDVRGGALSRDCYLPEGETLTLRDGTLIELPDDNDFYVVTGDRYENEAHQTVRHGYVMRLRRSVNGRPFMPLLYGSYNRVIQVTSDAIFTMTSGMIHGLNEYGPAQAGQCEYGHGSGGSGVVTCGDGSCNGDETCSSCTEDCGDCPARCGDDNCDVGESCRSCSSDCGDCPPEDECSLGQRRCVGTDHYSVCIESGGRLIWDTWLCPIESSCSDGQCWAPEPDPEPYCGDRSCDPDENCSSCSEDCGDCPVRCGDRSCNGSESCSSCPSDCGDCPARCGDGSCNGEEECSTCSRDCGRCRDPDPDPPVSGPVIHCESGSGGLEVTVSGLDPSTTLIEPVSSPDCVTYGSDTEGWSVPPTSGSSRECLPWRGSSSTYVFEMPARATRINFFLVDSSHPSGGAWFDLAMDWGPVGVPWEVTGDCHWIPGLIVQD